MSGPILAQPRISAPSAYNLAILGVIVARGSAAITVNIRVILAGIADLCLLIQSLWFPTMVTFLQGLVNLISVTKIMCLESKLDRIPPF
jgi:hypothetical protein